MFYFNSLCIMGKTILKICDGQGVLLMKINSNDIDKEVESGFTLFLKPSILVFDRPINVILVRQIKK